MRKHLSNLPAAFVGALLFVSMAGVDSATAQAFWRVEDTQTNANSYHYYYENPGAATIRVHVLGAVRLPGVWEVSEHTDLGQLIALSGGPPMTTRPSDSRLDISLKVYRPADGTQQIIFDDTFDNSLANPGAYPLIRDGDVLVVDMTSHQRFNWRDAASIVSTIGILALATERVSRTFLR